MTENIKKQLEYIEKRKHRAFRRELAKEELDKILPAIYNKNLSLSAAAIPSDELSSDMKYSLLQISHEYAQLLSSIAE